MLCALRTRSLLRRLLRSTAIALLAACVVRISFWHVENEVREAAYRHAFSHLYHNRHYWKATFIEVQYGCSCTDCPRVPVLTSPSLLTRFEGCRPPVKPVSACYFDEGEGQIADKKTGKTGVVFYTGAIWWVSTDTVRIEVGYYEGTLSASGNIYTLKRKDGRWVVVGDDMLWIS